ncbi:MAG: hypothetical protein Q4F15_04340 [Bacillota bacterium]|nr:hypothetical protein [Bacillota bacterium]
MKRRYLLLISSLSLLAILGAYPTYTLYGAFGIGNMYEDSFLGELKYKMERLEQTEGKRIVLVGGSALPFGIRSELLEEQFDGYTAVNLGMYASLGSQVMLDLAKARINEGDIFIISPEQHKQTLSSYFDATPMWQALDGAFGYFNLLSASYKEEMVLALPEFANSKYLYSRIGAPEGDGVYAKDSFDEYGDISSSLPSYNSMALGYDPNNRINFDSDVIESDFIDAMNSFYHYAYNRGASVYYHFAPSNELAVDENDSVDDYYDYLSSKLDFPILGDPNDSIFDSGWFFDTNFHLNNSGAILNSVRLIDDLKVALDDDSPTDIDIPDMPIVPDRELVDGDDSDLSCFLYEEKDDCYLITGLSDEASNRDSLIVPTKYNDKPIIAFSSSTFQNSGLTSLTIQSNIEYIEDASFSGSSISSLYIQNENPSGISVGNNLLDGSSLTIYVPEESYSRYLTNYFWSQYANSLQPM